MSESPPVQALPRPEATIDRAERALRRERRTLVDEQSAFEEFRSRVRGITAREPEDRQRLPLDRRRATGVRRVREAYAETVMSVPHYREEYDEGFHENVAREFSGELAASLTSGTRLYPHLKQSLLEAAREAVDRRGDVIDMLDAEARALERAGDRLVAVRDDLRALLDQPLDRAEFNALRRTRERLVALGERCDEVAADRQATLREHARSLPVDVEDVGGYLYGDCEHVHPVLAAVADLTDALDRALTSVDDLLATAR